MNALIQIINDEPRVSALTIAENTNNKYASVRDLINRHSEKLKQFGDISNRRFEIGGWKTI